MINNKLGTLFIILLVCSASAFGKTHKFIRDINYTLEKKQTQTEAREKAVTEIKRILLDELGNHVRKETSYLVEENDEEVHTNFVSKTSSFAQVLMKTKILEEEFSKKNLYLKVEIAIDKNELNKNLQQNGLGDNRYLLSKIYQLLLENNAPLVSILVSETSDELINNMKVLEEKQTGKNYADIKLDSYSRLVSGTQPFNGKYRLIYGNNTYAEFSLKNGYINGKYTFYTDKGLTVTEGEYIANKKTGIWYIYRVRSERSYVVRQYTYKNGVLNGEAIWYDKYGGKEIQKKRRFENGVAVYQENYTEYGIARGPINELEKRDGEWVAYDGDKLLSKSHWKNGKREGEFIIYHDNGQMREKSNYLDDRKFGEFISYHANGKIAEKCEYDKNERTFGVSEKYYDNGQLKLRIELKSNKEKDFISYHRNGQIDVKYRCLNVYKKEGPYVRYYENGQLEEEFHYHNDKQTGVARQWDEQGRLKQAEQMENGMINGICGYFRSGELIVFGQYVNNRKTGAWYELENEIVYKTIYDNGFADSAPQKVDKKIMTDNLKKLKQILPK